MENRPEQTEEVTFTPTQNGDFIISQNEPFADRHCFIESPDGKNDEDAFE